MGEKMPLSEERALRKACTKCGKEKQHKDFFKNPWTGERADLCKACLTAHIDNYDPETFMWILEMFDVPYVKHVWIEQTNKQVAKKGPNNLNGGSVIGMYLRLMRMNQYKDSHFKDSDKLNYENEQKIKKQQQYAANDTPDLEVLKEQLEAGEISQAQYDTIAKPVEIEQVDFIRPANSINEAEVIKKLTEEDIEYLTVKWGTIYQPSEWLKLEETYSKYADEYELNTDREEALKKICKISLRMDEAIDTGDTKAFKDLSSTYDQMRKSAKFTEAQNKEEEVRELDSIGELVAFVEREGGIIPEFENTIEYPEDKVDFTIKDIQNYINNLVRNELGLGDLIESYIEKAEQNKEMTVEEIMAEGFKDEEDDALTLEEEMAFEEFKLDEIEKEAALLAEQFGDDL